MRPKEEYILFAGPLPPPVHGQAIAFEKALKGIECKRIFVNENFESARVFSKIFRTLTLVVRIIWLFFSHNVNTVYFTCSRSKSGCLKDIILISVGRAFNRKIRIIAHLHGSDFSAFYSSLRGVLKEVVAWCYRHVETGIVLLPEMKKEFSQFFPRMKVVCVPNFYDSIFDDFDNLIQSSLVSRTSKTGILYFSNIIKTKGILELLEAFLEIAKKNDVFLTVAGNFISDEQLSSDKIREVFFEIVKKSEKIRYVGGNFRTEDKIRLFAESDIFVLPSYYKSEAFPISIIEAMRTGNVIVASHHKYLPQVVQPANGFLARPQSVNDLERVLQGILNNPIEMRKIQAHNIEEAKMRYSESRYLLRLQQILVQGHSATSGCT
jgi:glycosyltransferase involved in cell wall biosynthesis